MSRNMIVRSYNDATSNSDARILKQEPADNEAQLQSILRDHPDLLSLEEFDLEGPLLIVGKEMWLESGAVDLVGLAKGGEIVLIEFKTGPKNPDFRHALAQLLDYGSDLWTKSFDQFEDLARRYFSSEHCTDVKYKNKTSLWDAARCLWHDMHEEEWENTHKDKLAQQLRDGDMTYVLAAQQFTHSMKREIHYMNNISKGPRFYAAELVRFLGKDIEGRHAEAFECRVVIRPDETGSTNRDRTNRTKLLESVKDDSYRQALEKLLDCAERLKLKLNWGTLGVSIRVKLPRGLTTIAWLYPPEGSGFRGLTGITLGYEERVFPDRVPSEFEAYKQTASKLSDGSEVATKGIMGWRVSAEHLSSADFNKVPEAWEAFVSSGKTE